MLSPSLHYGPGHKLSVLSESRPGGSVRHGLMALYRRRGDMDTVS